MSPWTPREPLLAAPGLILGLLTLFSLTGCATVAELCKIDAIPCTFPPPVPSPPAPPPAPTPTPSPGPEPTPSPIPDPLPTPVPVPPVTECNTAPTGDEMCAELSGRWSPVMRDAIQTTAAKYAGGDGKVPYAAWDVYHVEIVQRIRTAGLLCAGFYGEEIGVFKVGDQLDSENYDPLSANGTPLWAYRSTCTPATLTRSDFPSRLCPYGKPLAKVEIQQRACDGTCFDATAKVCDRDYCHSLGINQDCCSPAGGHFAECEAAMYGSAGDDEPGPDWRLDGGGTVERRSLTMVKLHGGAAHGSVQACVPRSGVCSNRLTW